MCQVFSFSLGLSGHLLLRGKFQVKSKNLTTLTASQIMEVTARKLIALKYISVKFGVSNGDIKNADIKVHKEIDL